MPDTATTENLVVIAITADCSIFLQQVITSKWNGGVV